MKSSSLPDGIPVLSRGRHRTPRRGACFMELASVLAGERWSDHPSALIPCSRIWQDWSTTTPATTGASSWRHSIPSVVGRRGNDRTWLTVAVAVAAQPSSTSPKHAARAGRAACFKPSSCARTPGPIWPPPGGRRSSHSRWFLAPLPGSSDSGYEAGSTRTPSPSAARRRWSGAPSTASWQAPAPTSTAGCALCSRPASPRARRRSASRREESEQRLPPACVRHLADQLARVGAWRVLEPPDPSSRVRVPSVRRTARPVPDTCRQGHPQDLCGPLVLLSVCTCRRRAEPDHGHQPSRPSSRWGGRVSPCRPRSQGVRVRTALMSCPCGRRRAPGSWSRCRRSAARPVRSRSCSACWSRSAAGSVSSGSCSPSAYCTLLPGPEAQQLATYVGWLLNGSRAP